MTNPELPEIAIDNGMILTSFQDSNSPVKWVSSAGVSHL